jgi:hypothetical protein
MEMTMTYRGRVKNGAVVLDLETPLPEGAEVVVELVATPVEVAKVDGRGPTLAERLKNVIGKAKGLPPDASINMDHYLYGVPKRQ